MLFTSLAGLRQTAAFGNLGLLLDNRTESLDKNDYYKYQALECILNINGK